jgi:hypothetical protein
MSRLPARRRHKEEAGVQELDQGGGAPPDVRATNMTASSHSVVDDLTMSTISTRAISSRCLRTEEQPTASKILSCPRHPKGTAAPNGVAQPVEPERLIVRRVGLGRTSNAAAAD